MSGQRIRTHRIEVLDCQALYTDGLGKLIDNRDGGVRRGGCPLVLNWLCQHVHPNKRRAKQRSVTEAGRPPGITTWRLAHANALIHRGRKASHLLSRPSSTPVHHQNG